MIASETPNVVVIGAGIVGVSTALSLARAGCRVVVLDAAPPGGGASFGNQAMISPDYCTPQSVPGMLWKVPGWLRDPLGPLAIRPSYFPRALPYLLRWAKAGRFKNVVASSDAMHSLFKTAFDCYREFLGPRSFAELIRTNGQIFYWEGKPGEQPVRDALWRRHGVVAETLDLAELRRLVPALQRNVSHAIMRPNAGHTVNPQRLVQRIADVLRESGGIVRQENVARIIPEGDGYRIVTNVGNHMANRVVVAAGAWSARLLAPLGYHFPLETERGYHVTIPKPNIEPPPVPVACIDRPAGVSPFEEGLRCAGTVEFAGLDAPMNQDRANVLLRRTKQVFPGIEFGDYSLWMGHRPSFPDSLPIIANAPRHKGLVFAFGHGHSGMTSGPPTGRLVAELVMGHTPSIDLRPFRATRFQVRRDHSDHRSGLPPRPG